MSDILLTTEQVAEMLHLSPRTIEGLRARRLGPAFVRIGRRGGRGGRVLYREQDVRRFLERNVVQTEEAGR